MAFDQIKYQNDYIREHYARLSIQIPKENKGKIEKHWKEKGYKSFNAYVNDLIAKDMNGGKNINVGDISQSGDNNSITIG